MRIGDPSCKYFAEKISSSKPDRFGITQDGVVQKAEIEGDGQNTPWVAEIKPQPGGGNSYPRVTYEQLKRYEKEHGDGNGKVSTEEFQRFLESRSSFVLFCNGETYLYEGGKFLLPFHARLMEEAFDRGLELEAEDAIRQIAKTSAGTEEFLERLARESNISFSDFNQVLLAFKGTLVERGAWARALQLQAQKLFSCITIARNEYFSFIDNVSLRLEWDKFLKGLSQNEQAMVQSAAIGLINEKSGVRGRDQARLYMYYLMLTRSSDYFLEQAILTDYASELAEKVTHIFDGNYVTTGNISVYLEATGERLSHRSDSLLIRSLGISQKEAGERYSRSRLESSVLRVAALWQGASRGFAEAYLECANLRQEYLRLEQEKAKETKLDSAVEAFDRSKAGSRRRMQPIWQSLPGLAKEYYSFARTCFPDIDSSITFRIDGSQLSREAQATLVDHALKTNFARSEQRIVGNHAYAFGIEQALRSPTLMSCIELCLASFAGFYGIDLGRIPIPQQDPDQMNGLEVAGFLRREDGSPLFNFVLDAPVREGNGWLGYVLEDAVTGFNFRSNPVGEGEKTRTITSGLVPLTEGLSRAAFVGLAEHYDLAYEDDFGRGHYEWEGGHSFILTYEKDAQHPQGSWRVMEANSPERGTGFQIHELTEAEELESFFNCYDRFRFLPLVQGGNLFNDLLVEKLSVQRPGAVQVASR